MALYLLISPPSCKSQLIEFIKICSKSQEITRKQAVSKPTTLRVYQLLKSLESLLHWVCIYVRDDREHSVYTVCAVLIPKTKDSS